VVSWSFLELTNLPSEKPSQISEHLDRRARAAEELLFYFSSDWRSADIVRSNPF
jgi:hypothetical protein